MNESANFEIFPWNEHFVTGIPQIDEQHKRLVHLVNMLAANLIHESSTPDLNNVFAELADYAVFHFQTEEAVWHRFLSGDEWESGHKESHEKFVTEVLALKNEQGSKPLHDVLEDIVFFLTRWLAFHILDSDRRMAKVVLAVQSGNSLQQAKQLARQETTEATNVLIETVLAMYDTLSRRTLQLMKETVERQKAEQNARALAQRYRLLMQSTPEGVHILDGQGNIIEANEAFCRHLGCTQEEISRLSVFDFEANLTPGELRNTIGKLLNDHARFETLHRRKDGTLVEVEVMVNGVELDGSRCLFALSHDITQRKRTEEMIRNLAFHDPLTGLPNRRLLMDRFRQTMASCIRNARQGALLLLDLDHFKMINDTLGHDAGDLLLQQVAQRLESCVREGDTVARLGGDEFVVMLVDLSERDAETIAQVQAVNGKILETLNRPYLLCAREYFCTPSIGATFFGAEGQTYDDLLKQADSAMYQAKQAGRNTLCFYNSANT